MPQIFNPEHYRTSQQYRTSFEGEPSEAEILAEMDLTVNALQGHDSALSIGRDDLIAHHFLHYGGLRGAARFALAMFLSGDYKEFVQSDAIQQRLAEFSKRLTYALRPDRLSAPLPLGRFSMSAYPIGSTPGDLKLPEDFVDYFEGVVPAEPIPGRKPRPFLYPREGVSLSYTATSRTDTSSGQAMINELANYNPSLVDKIYPNIGRSDLEFPSDMPRLHIDEVALEAEGSEEHFAVISSESAMLAVEQIPHIDA